MANYIIHTNSQEISIEFYRLWRPIPLPSGDEIYSMYEVHTHPTDGRKAFGFENDEPILVHHDWDGVDADILTTAIGLNQGQSTGFNNQLQSAIKIPQGAEPPSGYVLGRFPSSAIMNSVGEIKSQTFMENDGWFPEEEILAPTRNMLTVVVDAVKSIGRAITKLFS